MTARSTVFYSGAQMEPATIRRADPSARFVARGSVAAGEVEIVGRFAGSMGERVWGIVVETAEGNDVGGPTLDVTLDDGRMVTATLAEPVLAGEPAAVLANARYWELPPAHVSALAAALNVVEEE